MKMKQGPSGSDFSGTLWNENRIGIMYGQWKVDYVTSRGRIDESKLTAEHLRLRFRPYQALDGTTVLFNGRWVPIIKHFLVDMQEGDKVIVAHQNRNLENVIGLAEVGEVDLEWDAGRVRPSHGEVFKCRKIRMKREYPLACLPFGFWLLRQAGRRSLQETGQMTRFVDLLANFTVPQVQQGRLRRHLLEIPLEEQLNYLHPKQWEVLCLEFLRNRRGLRLSLLPGSTLKDYDLVGSAADGVKVVAQCKNSESPAKIADIRQWVHQLGPGTEKYYFSRGGFSEGEVRGCDLVSRDDIANWLEESDNDFRNVLFM
jgi:hypothetical protein